MEDDERFAEVIEALEELWDDRNEHHYLEVRSYLKTLSDEKLSVLFKDVDHLYRLLIRVGCPFRAVNYAYPSTLVPYARLYGLIGAILTGMVRDVRTAAKNELKSRGLR